MQIRKFLVPCDLEIWRMTLKNWKTIGHLFCATSLCIISYPLVNSNCSYSPETPNLGQIPTIFRTVWPWKVTDDLAI